MSKRNGKGKGKAFDTIVKQKMGNTDLVGELKENHHVMAKLEGENFRLAKIIALTKKDFYKKRAYVKKEEKKSLEDDESKPTKYYVHFINEDRRLDRWLEEKDLHLDVMKVEEELKKYYDMKEKEKENVQWDNNENQNMDEKQVKEHEEATKIKTINYI
jgi:hypothetical protein